MATDYPPVGFHFNVAFGFLPGDSKDARFQEVGGLTSELGIEEVVEGGENRFSHRLPTRGKFGNLILKRGLLSDSQLISWCKNAIENFLFAPATVNVTLQNENHEPLADTYSFVKAWPVKWSVSDFKASDNAIVVETLELAYTYFTRIKR
ncbi:putative phage tail protein [Desulforapulum autotrophicum HRM2]|uniref:Phage tail protein n=1 Tax=Desulforapulum autotrophicum (strain ATCC 43914 / DSM 3382 / VKM B-1955 / HRM2) TaxID=177437 RepID=C0Q8T8_DESAH|nr:phage tail protein [Desulforapulum autotrophicum]ACN14428.1 putative phage tail protein [Desulforapulum autotrophicum HRM2]